MTETRKRDLQAELDGLTVHRETLVGWDENTPPNETLDQYGNLLASNRGVVPIPDNRSPIRRVYDDPGVETLRAHLRDHNGIRGIEICDSSEVERAARIFRRDGFVVVRDLLNAEQLERWRAGLRRGTQTDLRDPRVRASENT